LILATRVDTTCDTDIAMCYSVCNKGETVPHHEIIVTVSFGQVQSFMNESVFRQGEDK